MNADEVTNRLLANLSEYTGKPADTFQITERLDSQGVDSLTLTFLLADLEQILGSPVPRADLRKLTSIESFVEYAAEAKRKA